MAEASITLFDLLITVARRPIQSTTNQYIVNHLFLLFYVDSYCMDDTLALPSGNIMKNYTVSCPTSGHGARAIIYSNDFDGEPVLEIGSDLRGCHKMLALCVCIEEIDRFLDYTSSLEYPVGELAHNMITMLREVRDKMDADCR